MALHKDCCYLTSCHLESQVHVHCEFFTVPGKQILNLLIELHIIACFLYFEHRLRTNAAACTPHPPPTPKPNQNSSHISPSVLTPELNQHEQDFSVSEAVVMTTASDCDDEDEVRKRLGVLESLNEQLIGPLRLKSTTTNGKSATCDVQHADGWSFMVCCVRLAVK